MGRRRGEEGRGKGGRVGELELGGRKASERGEMGRKQIWC